MTTNRHPLFQAAIDADNAFQAELVSVYGKGASDARYDYAKSTATPRLDDLAAAKIEADLAWLDESARSRKAD
jgi:hypothetical protein